jgi:hypothetical protein
VLAREAEKAARRKAKSDERAALLAGWVNPLAVGDVLVNSWGYDRTPRERTRQPARRSPDPSWLVPGAVPGGE